MSTNPSYMRTLSLRFKKLFLEFFEILLFVDHHEDSNDFADVPKQIKFVGSCATLIAEQIRIASNTFFEFFPDACEMLLATILIDTYNLDLHSGRTTEQDVFTAEILSRLTDADTDQLFITIQTGFLLVLSIIVRSEGFICIGIIII